MPEKLSCGHTCNPCPFTTLRKKDLAAHEGAGRPHRFCNEGCPRNTSLKKPNIRVQTQDSYLAASGSTSTTSAQTESGPSSSRRKRSRPSVTDEEAFQKLRWESARRSSAIGKLGLCCVLDPGRSSKSLKDIRDNCCWVEWECPEEGDVFKTLVNCPELRGYVFPIPARSNTVMIYDWAYVAASCFRQAGFKVQFETWERFSKRLLGASSPASMVEELRNEGFDCIVGGIDLSLRAPLKDWAQNQLRQAFLALEDAFPIFPSPRGCDGHGAKVAFNIKLEEISKEMGMRRPTTKKLDNLAKPPCGWVLKREYSDTSRDVYVPPHPLKTSEEREIKKAAAFIKKRMAASEGDDCSWLCQEFVPFISTAEIRFMCVGGAPIREVVTGRNPRGHHFLPGETWAYEGNDSLKTVSALQEVVDRGKELNDVSAFDLNRGTAEKQLAREQLAGFVTEFLEKLARRDGENSGLRVFCRVDVSVFVDEDQRVSLFVNEVERGITTCLFTGSGPSVVGLVGTDLAWPLASWILTQKERLEVN